MGAWLTMGGCTAARGVLGTTFLVDDHQAESRSPAQHYGFCSSSIMPLRRSSSAGVGVGMSKPIDDA